MMRCHGEVKYNDKSPIPKVTINVFQNVIKRIQKKVLASNIEVGGKFLGRIKYISDRLVEISVESYIDSGPNLDNSRTHLIPDGIYQEAMFRIVESYYPEIEHLGSWHSHHCNGLSELSNLDVQGYYESVNNHNYNLDYFLALLVTSVDSEEFKWHLFIRGENYKRLERSDINIVPSIFPLEELLEEAEDQSIRSNVLKIPHQKNDSKKENVILCPEDNLRKILLEDKNWFGNQYPNACLFRCETDKSFSWKWFLRTKGEDIYIIYRYVFGSKIDSPYVALQCKFKGNLIHSDNVPLDKNRFYLIKNFEMQVIEKLAALNESNCTLF